MLCEVDHTLVERCARALCQMHGHDPDAMAHRGPPLHGPNGALIVHSPTAPAWMFYAADVRAVLEEALEPTDEMATTDAAFGVISRIAEKAVFFGALRGFHEEAREAAVAIWRAVLAAALTPPR